VLASSAGEFKADVTIMTVNHFILAGKEAEAAAQIEQCMCNPAVPSHVRSEFEVIRRNLPSHGTQGYLVKAKSMAMQGQQNRYCVIKERAIFYYKSSNLKDLKEPKGAIPLSTHKLIAHGQQQNAFWVFELQGDKKSYFLFNKTKEEMSKWIRAIQVEQAILSSSSVSTGIGRNLGTKTGYLVKTKFLHGPDMFKVVRNRFFKLTASCLQWWESENEMNKGEHALGSVDLSLCSFHTHGNIGGKYCYEVISPNKNWFLWSDNVDQLQEWIDLITHQCRLRCTSVSTSVMDNDSWLDQ